MHKRIGINGIIRIIVHEGLEPVAVDNEIAHSERLGHGLRAILADLHEAVAVGQGLKLAREAAERPLRLGLERVRGLLARALACGMALFPALKAGPLSWRYIPFRAACASMSCRSTH